MNLRKSNTTIRLFAVTLLSVGTLATQNYAQASSNESTSTSQLELSQFTKCDSSPEKFAAALEERDEKIIEWTRKQKAEDLSSPELDKTPMGRLVLLFTAHKLPDAAPFRSATRSCWARYTDFKNALEAKKSEKASRDASDWQTCLEVSALGYPAEAKELMACWDKVRKQKSKK